MVARGEDFRSLSVSMRLRHYAMDLKEEHLAWYARRDDEKIS